MTFSISSCRRPSDVVIPTYRNRPAFFIAKSVGRCSSHDIRLWTCSRSKRGTPQSRRDSSIWSGPRAPEEIQTLLAEKSCDGRPTLFQPYPMTSCEEPYIGEESINLPPS